MTVKTIQELYYIGQSDDIDLDKSIKMVGVVTGKTPEQVEKMKMNRFNAICKQIEKQFDIVASKMVKGKPQSILFVNGRIYRMRYDITRMEAAQYVEAATFAPDLINNLHKILATMAEPVRWRGRLIPYERSHPDIATDMEQVDFEVAYHAAVFFYTLYRVSMQVIHPYLIKDLTAKGAKKEEVEATLNALYQVLDGYTMPNWSQTSKEYLLNRFGS